MQTHIYVYIITITRLCKVITEFLHRANVLEAKALNQTNLQSSTVLNDFCFLSPEILRLLLHIDTSDFRFKLATSTNRIFTLAIHSDWQFRF